MNRLLAFAVSLLSALSLGATAATIRPVAGSTPQTTCVFCFFPNALGVVVRDDAGHPVANVPVTFSIPGSDGVITVDFASNEFTVMTGADGVASARLMGTVKDKATVTATTPGISAAATFHLKIKDHGPTRFELVSGDNQYANIGKAFAQPWVVRALDRHGHPVPDAAVFFTAAAPAGYPAATFGGAEAVYVAADAAGIATSPRLIANGIPGSGMGSAQGFGAGDSPFVPFYFNNLGYSTRYQATLEWSPRSTQIGVRTGGALMVRVADTFFPSQLAANVTVVFATDPACGSWVGPAAAEVTVMTDAQGVASSPIFIGTKATTACAISAQPGESAPLALFLHVFQAENVVMTVDPTAIETRVGQVFRILLTMTESGLRINGSPVELRSIVADASGASASADLLYYAGDPDAWLFEFIANGFPGSYVIELYRGPVHVSIPVTQRP